MKMRFLLIGLVAILSLFVTGFAQSGERDGFDRSIKYKILFDDT